VVLANSHGIARVPCYLERKLVMLSTSGL